MVYEKNILADSGSDGNCCGVSSSHQFPHRDRFAGSCSTARNHQPPGASLLSGATGDLRASGAGLCGPAPCSVRACTGSRCTAAGLLLPTPTSLLRASWRMGTLPRLQSLPVIVSLPRTLPVHSAEAETLVSAFSLLRENPGWRVAVSR